MSESLTIMFKDDAKRTACLIVELERHGATWTASVSTEEQRDYLQLAGAGAGPDVFAICRELADRATVSARAKRAGIRLLTGN